MRKTTKIIKRGARDLCTAGNAWRLLIALLALAMLLVMCEGARWATEQTPTEIHP